MADVGRPTEYTQEYATQAEKLCKLGMTDPEIALFFEVDPVTVWRWKHRHPEFCKAMTRGKKEADDLVEQSLWRRATGYSQPAVKIFMPAGAAEPVYASYVEHLPPDTGAAKMWLCNRRPEKWRDKQAVEHSGTITTLSSLVEASMVQSDAVPASKTSVH